MSDGLIFYSNLWNLSSDIWDQLSEMSEDFREHCIREAGCPTFGSSALGDNILKKLREPEKKKKNTLKISNTKLRYHAYD